MKRNTRRIALVEEIDDVFFVTRGSLDATKRSLSIVPSKKSNRLHDALKKGFFGKTYDQAIIALSSEHAVTIEGVSHGTRARPQEPLHEGELDSLLYKLYWDFLNEYRPIAARKLNIGELEPAVANIAVCGVTMDGHRMFNPLDFSGKEISIHFRTTFVPRGLLDELQSCSEAVEDPLMVIERGAILSSAIRGDHALVIMSAKVTDIYAVRGNESIHIDRLPWGSMRFSSALATFFGVDESIVGGVLARYTKNQISEKARRSIERIVKDEAFRIREWIGNAVKTAGIDRSSLVYYISASPLKTAETLLQIVGFELSTFEGQRPYDEPMMRIANNGEKEHISVQTQILFEFPYLHPQYMYLNQLLRRRAKWLVPEMNTQDNEKRN